MNRIISGRLKGKKIKIKGDSPVIIIHCSERIPIDRLIVQRLQVLNIEKNKKVLSGFLRGFFADC